MKTLLLHPVWITSLGLVVLMPGCKPPTSTVTPPTPIEIPSPTVSSSPSPSPTIPGDPFLKGVDKAASATNLAQSAQTPADWSLVISQWQRAIAFMKAVPTSSPNRAAAQKLIPTYQQALALAQQQAKRGPNAAPVGAGNASDGTILIAGADQAASGAGNSTEGKKTEVVNNVDALIQQQTQFFLQKKRFASNLTELGTSIPADTPDYTYSTNSAQERQTMITAIAKQDGQPSYTGAVFVIKDERNNDETVTGICFTQPPSKTPPAMPQLAGKQVKCAPGSAAAS